MLDQTFLMLEWIIQSWFLEKRPEEELNKYINFFKALGLPTTLKEMKLENASAEELMKIGKQATIEGETIHNMPFEVTAEDVANALQSVNEYVLGL